MSTHNRTIVHRTGTYRTATVEQTWERVAPMLDRFTITRVADITMLDEIGLPVHLAYRPVGKTLAVSVGTGLTATQSKVSAVMEAIEAWHAENPRLEHALRAPAERLSLGYRLTDLQLADRSPVTDAIVLDWVAGRGLLDGGECLVPFDTILLDFTRRGSWAHALFRPSSNGLASGNTADEATLHALHELVERDCIQPYTLTPLGERVYVDPATSHDPSTKAILAALLDAGCSVEVCDITGRVGISCYAATIWSPDVPMLFGGFGCHVDAHVAVGRALAEAAQSRLTTISGARDDIDYGVYRDADPLAEPPFTTDRELVAVRDVKPDADDVGELVRWCAARIAAVTGVEPFVVDLTHDDIGIAVSKVFAPGLRLFDDRALANRPGESHV